MVHVVTVRVLRTARRFELNIAEGDTVAAIKRLIFFETEVRPSFQRLSVRGVRLDRPDQLVAPLCPGDETLDLEILDASTSGANNNNGGSSGARGGPGAVRFVVQEALERHVTRTVPRNGASSVGFEDGRVTVELDREVTGVDEDAIIRVTMEPDITESQPSRVAGTVNFDSAARLLTFTAFAPFEPDMQYRVRLVGAAVHGFYGQLEVTDMEFSFRTKPFKQWLCVMVNGTALMINITVGSSFAGFSRRLRDAVSHLDPKLRLKIGRQTSDGIEPIDSDEAVQLIQDMDVLVVANTSARRTSYVVELQKEKEKEAAALAEARSSQGMGSWMDSWAFPSLRQPHHRDHPGLANSLRHRSRPSITAPDNLHDHDCKRCASHDEHFSLSRALMTDAPSSMPITLVKSEPSSPQHSRPSTGNMRKRPGSSAPRLQSLVTTAQVPDFVVPPGTDERVPADVADIWHHATPDHAWLAAESDARHSVLLPALQAVANFNMTMESLPGASKFLVPEPATSSPATTKPVDKRLRVVGFRKPPPPAYMATAQAVYTAPVSNASTKRKSRKSASMSVL